MKENMISQKEIEEILKKEIKAKAKKNYSNKKTKHLFEKMCGLNEECVV